MQGGGRAMFNSAVPVLVLGLGLAGLLGAMYYLWLDTTRVELVANGAPITNAEQVLQDAEASMREIAEVDGAPVSGEASCHFGPGLVGPGVFCGPIWLGVSREDNPWLRYNVNYRLTDDGAQAELDTRPTTAEADTQTFRRPDGRRPATIATPTYPTTGRRTERGILLLDEAGILTGVQTALAAAAGDADENGVTIGDRARCFFREGPNLIRNVEATDGLIWCGPARSADSDRDARWIRARGFWADGPTVGTTMFANIGSFDWGPVPLRDDSRLVDAAGVEPSNDLDTDRPPRPGDLTEIVAGVADLATTDQGRLNTSGYGIEFSGFARTERFGSGAGSFTAADGFEFVVATVAPSDRPPRTRGSITIDGQERPLPDWPRETDQGATIVVSVPTGSQQIELTVEDNGRPQTISLIDGTKRPGFPLAFYRPTAEANLGFSRSIDMPTGEPVIFSGRLTTAEWSPYVDDFKWLPESDAYLTLTFDEFSVDRPCCDVTIDETVARFALILPDGPPSEGSGTQPDRDDQSTTSTAPRPPPPDSMT